MIDITENALKRIKDISLKQESNLFRISVDGGGCQGFSYKFSFDKIKGSDDHEINFDQITVLIDKTSMDFLNGSKLDFVRWASPIDPRVKFHKCCPPVRSKIAKPPFGSKLLS